MEQLGKINGTIFSRSSKLPCLGRTVVWELHRYNTILDVLVFIQLELLCDLFHLLFADVVSNAVHGGVSAQLFQITAGVALGLTRYFLQVNRVT